MEIKATFMLLPTEVGGRHNSIRSGYRPDWRLNSTPHITNGIISKLNKEPLSPGEITDITILPFLEDNWLDLSSGDKINAYEGSNLIGVALVKELINLEEL